VNIGYLLSASVVTLTGCATLDANQCRRAYDVGFRDAILGRQRQEAVYGPLCSRNGVQLDTSAYVQGWQEGKYEFDQRAAQDGLD
jgi:hypothetical protein